MTPKEAIEQRLGYKISETIFNRICQKCNVYTTESISNAKITRMAEIAKLAQMILRQEA